MATRARPPRATRAPRGPWLLGACLSGIAVLLIAAHVAVHNVPGAPELARHENQLRLYLDVSGEHNLWAWFNGTLLAVGASGHLVAGLLARRAGDRSWWAWLLTAALLLALSLDDVTVLHERLHPLGERLGGGSGLTYAAWLVPGVAVAALVAGAFAVLARRLPRRPRWTLVAGIGAFLGAAVGIEAVGNALLDTRGPGELYAAFMLTEELLEAVGAVALLLTPLLALVPDEGRDGTVTLRYPRSASGGARADEGAGADEPACTPGSVPAAVSRDGGRPSI